MKKRGMHILFGIVILMILFDSMAFAQQAISETAAPTPPPVPPLNAAPVPSDYVELKIDLPQELCIDHHLEKTNIPRLEPNSRKRRAPFWVPKEVVLLSRGKKVSASDSNPVLGNLVMVTDGDKDNMKEESFVEFGPGLQWVQVDLEGVFELYAVVVWHYHARDRVYHDVIFQISNDPKFLKNVRTIYNNDYDNSANQGAGEDYEYIDSYQGRLVDAKGIKGRYVRCYSNGSDKNDLNQLLEIEVYGRLPVKTSPKGGK